MKKSILLISVLFISYASVYCQTVKRNKQIVYFEGTTQISYEYEYIIGHKTQLGAIISRDEHTRLITGYDPNTYSFGQIVPDGKWIEYYRNGQVKETFLYEVGLRNGPAKSFYEDGSVKWERVYDNGNLQGEYKSYYPSGTLMQKFAYENNHKINSGYEYFEDGKIKK